MVEFDLAFPHEYELEQIGELPGTGRFNVPLIYFPPPKGRPEHSGLWLRVRANRGTAWIGVFAFGYASSASLSRVVSSPDPKRMCVISAGAAYFVSADQPEVWEQIPIIPVRDVRPLPEQNLLILSDFTGLAAYGASGLIWRSPRLCWDDLKISSMSNDLIEGTGYDPTNSLTHESRFIVDLKTGRSLLPAPVSSNGKSLW